MYFVVDTNVVVSGLFFPKTLPSKSLSIGLIQYKLAISQKVHKEYMDVLTRKKFDKYITLEQRMSLLDRLLLRSETFLTEEEIIICRDPKDDMFLELAVSANAACIVSGDPHLLELHPFRGIPILKPSDFLENFYK